MKKLINRKIIRPIVQLTSATVIGQLLIFAGMPVIARLFDANAFGLFAIFNSITGILLVIAGMRIELAIPLASNQRNAAQLFVISVLINMVIAFMTLVVVAVFGGQLQSWLGFKDFETLFWLLPVVLISGGIYKVVNLFSISQSKYRQIAVSKILQSTALVLSQILLGIFGMGAYGLAWGVILGQIIGASWLAKGLPLFKMYRDFFSTPTRTFILLKKNKNYPKYDMPAALVNGMSQHIPSLLLAFLFSPKVAGIYFLADRVLSVPVGLLGRAVGQVLHGNVRQDIKTGSLEARFNQTCGYLAIIILVPMIMIHFYAEPLIEIYLGVSWIAAGQIASWLIFAVAIQFIYSPISIMLVTTHGQLKNFIIHFFLLALKAVSLIIGYLADDYILAIQFMTLAHTLGYGIALIIVARHLRKFTVSDTAY